MSKRLRIELHNIYNNFSICLHKVCGMSASVCAMEMFEMIGAIPW